MYQYLNGTLVEKTATTAVVDVGGVGYYLQIPVSTFSALPELGKTVKILTHFVVREDVQALYGFFTNDERSFFRSLISVSGIGPKTALTALSGIPVPELKRAIIDGDLAVLSGVSGIGKKTAERMVVELREKIVTEDRKSFGGSDKKSSALQPVAEDSVRALIELGYKKQNAQDAIDKALKNFEPGKATIEDLIRISLRYI